MFINTTINMNCDMLGKITNACSLLNISKSTLLSLLLKEMLMHQFKNVSLFSRVTYQQRSAKKDWRCVHISLRCDLYEKAIDFRKLSKRSVSFIFSLAVSNFLQKIINKLMKTNEIDNYTSQYIFMSNITYKINSYAVYYEIPEEENTKKKLE